jgi:hypothetical protein
MWTAIDIFIGLALCYALISLFCTAIQEFLAQMFNSRGKLLVEALKAVRLDGMISLMQPDLVNNPGGVWRTIIPDGWGKPGTETAASRAGEAGAAAANVQASSIPTTKSLTTTFDGSTGKTAPVLKWRVPFDIPADVFSRTLLTNIGLLTSGQLAERFKDDIEKLELPTSLKTRLLTMAASKQATVDDAVATVSQWYGGFMAQVEHWATRRAQSISIIIGLIVAFGLNIDTVDIAKSLQNDASQRAAVVALAEKISKDGKLAGCPAPQSQLPANAAASDYKDAASEFAQCRTAVLEEAYPFPIGWDLEGRGFWELLTQLLSPGKIVGLLLSAIALSLGSRFWFDTLKSLLSLRTGGQPKETASQHSQGKDKPAA